MRDTFSENGQYPWIWSPQTYCVLWVCVFVCICVSGPLDGHLQDQWFPLGLRISSLFSLLICWDWLACSCHSLHRSPSTRACLAGSRTSACHFSPTGEWEGKDRERREGGEWVAETESVLHRNCEFACRRVQIPPNATTTCLMFSWSCKNKTRIYMRELELWSELNGNAERMWQSYHEKERTREHQAYIWFNRKWYGIPILGLRNKNADGKNSTTKSSVMVIIRRPCPEEQA